jgi:hypothetical protein
MQGSCAESFSIAARREKCCVSRLRQFILQIAIRQARERARKSNTVEIIRAALLFVKRASLLHKDVNYCVISAVGADRAISLRQPA